MGHQRGRRVRGWISWLLRGRVEGNSNVTFTAWDYDSDIEGIKMRDCMFFYPVPQANSAKCTHPWSGVDSWNQ